MKLLLLLPLQYDRAGMSCSSYRKIPAHIKTKIMSLYITEFLMEAGLHNRLETLTTNS